MRSYLLLLPLVACLIAVGPDAPVAAQEKDPPSDSVTPIASGITEFPTTLDIDGQKIAVALAYAKQGNTVFVLPAWHVRVVRRLTDGSPAAKLLPSDLLVSPDVKGEQRLEFDVVNLLENEVAEKAIQEKLKARIAQQSGQPADKLAFAVPQIKAQSYRFTLIGPGRGDEVLPAEVPISPDIQRLPSGVVRLTFKADALKAVEKENGGPLKLAQAHLRAVGLMRVRFEQTQVVAQVEFIRGAMTEMRKVVSSIKDSRGNAPEAFVEMPDGGSASSNGVIAQLAQQSLSVTISARAGADTAPILALVQAELNGLIERSKVQVSEENKRVAVLLDKQVTISGTMGEIHKLAKQDEKQRDEAFKAAFEDHQARSYGRASSYNGSVSVNILGYGGSVGGGTGNSSNESQEDRTKREMEVAKKQFDRAMKEFAGKVPTLTGIGLEDATSAKAFEQVSKSFEDKKLTTGDSLHRWPLIALGGQADTALSPQELVRQYALLKADYEVLQKLVGTPAQLAEAKANMERVKALAADLERKAAALDAALTKVDGAAVAKMEKEVADLKRYFRVPHITLRGGFSSWVSAAFSPDGRRVAAIGTNHRECKVFDVAKGAIILKVEASSTLSSVAFSPDGMRIATGDSNGVAEIWNAETGKRVAVLEKHGSSFIDCITFSPDGKRVATAGSEFAKVWNAESGKELLTFKGHTGRVLGVSFSPDGKRLATSCDDKTATVWDAESGKELLTFKGHTDELRKVAFSPDGKRVATTSWGERIAKVWDAESGKELLTLTGHADGVGEVAFSPDGKRIATASGDGTARLWDAGTGRELLQLKGHTGVVSSVAFSSDGRRLVTGGGDDHVKVWDIE